MSGNPERKRRSGPPGGVQPLTLWIVIRRGDRYERATWDSEQPGVAVLDLYPQQPVELTHHETRSARLMEEQERELCDHRQDYCRLLDRGDLT